MRGGPAPLRAGHAGPSVLGRAAGGLAAGQCGPGPSPQLRSPAPAPGPRIYRCARPALALRGALRNNTVSRVGNETWEENKASRGGRRRGTMGPGGGRPSEWRGGGPAGLSRSSELPAGPLVAPRARGSQQREASVFPRRARSGNWECEQNPESHGVRRCTRETCGSAGQLLGATQLLKSLLTY